MCLCCVFSAWLDGDDDPVVERINQRIQDITGLSVDTAELLQVIPHPRRHFSSCHLNGLGTYVNDVCLCCVSGG